MKDVLWTAASIVLAAIVMGFKLRVLFELGRLGWTVFGLWG